MAQVPAEMAQRYLYFSHACVECTTEEAFQRLVREHARSLLPHTSLLAVIGRIDLEHLELRRVVGVDHPTEHVMRLGSTLAMSDRPVVAHWLRTTTPLVLDLPEARELMSSREFEEIEHFKLGRLGIHGVVDVESRTGTYLSFAGLSPTDHQADQRRLLSLMAPPLSQALLAVERAAVQLLSATSLLSKTERELLKWVASGRSNREIAALRNRSVATVRNQLHSAFAKLGVGSRSEAVRLVLNSPRLVDPCKK